MGVAHVFHVLNKLNRELVVGVEGAALGREGVARARVVAVLVGLTLRLVAMATPRTQVNLVDIERLRHVVMRATVLKPFIVAPFIACDVHEARGGSGRLLGVKRVRIGLIEQVALVGLNDVLIQVTLLEAGYKALPHVTCADRAQLVGGGVPVVKIAHHMHAFHIRHPDAKMPTLDTVLNIGVGAHLLPAALPGAVAKHVDVIIGHDEQRLIRCGCGRGILGLLLHATRPIDLTGGPSSDSSAFAPGRGLSACDRHSYPRSANVRNEHNIVDNLSISEAGLRSNLIRRRTCMRKT